MSEIVRKLARIEKIEELRPIEGADAIECAIVLGWPVVVKKDTFLPGDLCVFFEIDSFLPLDDPRYSFLAKNAIKWNGLQGIRLRTVKLRKQISQGLVLPLSDFPELGSEIATAIMDASSNWTVNGVPYPYEMFLSLELTQDLKCIMGLDPYEELANILNDELKSNNATFAGFDVTNILKILKWEAPIPAQLAGTTKGNFPTHLVPKTDQERIQNIFRDVVRRGDIYEVTTKLDGSSMTAYMLEDDVLNICSRNWDLAETEENSFWKCANSINLKERMVDLKRLLGTSRIAVQGELIGPGVQKNFEGLDKLQFRVFDIYNIEKAVYIGAIERQKLCHEVRLDHVPVESIGVLFDFDTVERAVDSADGWSLNPKVRREGVVYKSLTDPSYSFKIISNRYLLDEK